MRHTARQIFGERAAFYATSAAHTDKSVLDRVVALARPWPGAIALDVGTGTGHTALALAPRVKRAIATDITPEMIDEGRKLKDESGARNVAFGLADARALPFDDAAFDIVTCRRAAHHFDDLRGALREMGRVLTRDGRLVIDDRSVPDDDFVDAAMNRLDQLHDPSHVREYRPAEWRAMLAETGFRVETLAPYAQRRPLSSLTANAAPEQAAQIRAIVSSFDAAQRAAMGVEDGDGQTWTTHWYVMLAAVKRAG